MRRGVGDRRMLDKMRGCSVVLPTAREVELNMAYAKQVRDVL